jgi:hypothetical protein
MFGKNNVGTVLNVPHGIFGSHGIGKHNNMPDSAFDPRELALGVKEEMEHTNNLWVAKNIAKDHLAGEDPHYYSKLKSLFAKK